MDCIFFSVADAAPAEPMHMSFPQGLEALGIEPTRTLDTSLMTIDTDKLQWKINRSSLHIDDTLLALINPTADVFMGHITRPAKVTLSGYIRAEAGIHRKAQYFVWSFPLGSLSLQETQETLRCPELCFLINGGFVYLDTAFSVVSVNAVTMHTHGSFRLYFEPAQKLPPEFVPSLQKSRNFQPVTLKGFKEAGAELFTWIPPGFSLGSSGIAKHGAFVYLIKSNAETAGSKSFYLPMCCCTGKSVADHGDVGIGNAPQEDPFAEEHVDHSVISGPIIYSVAPRTTPRTPAVLSHSMTKRVIQDDKITTVQEKIPSGVLICILGGRSFQNPESQQLVEELGKAFEKRLKRTVVVATGGLPGIQETFVKSLGEGFPVVNLVEKGRESNYGVGKDILCGEDLQERMSIYGKVGEIYLTIEGGPGVANEAKDAFDTGALVLPMMWTGGASSGMFGFPPEALLPPECCSAKHWQLLKDKAFEDPAQCARESAAAVVHIIVGYIDKR